MRLSPGERLGKGTTHACEEFVHVLSGEVTITLEGKTFVLGVGDSAHMDARRLLWGRRRFSCRSTPPQFVPQLLYSAEWRFRQTQAMMVERDHVAFWVTGEAHKS